MKIDRKIFFDGIRGSPMPKKLNTKQVDGINFVLDEFERRKCNDLRWLAYMLATMTVETDWTMQPIREKDNQARTYLKSKKYYPWIGRGYVQLTWDYNYKKMSKLLGVDLIKNPDLALDPKIAAEIMFQGMVDGIFTGKKLGDYFTKDKSDWVNARRIINGLDRAAEIGGYAKQFYADLVLATGAKG